MKESSKPSKSIDEYIARYPRTIQAILKKIRTVIKKSAPGAEEKISYGMPAFAQNGILVYFAAFKNHIGFFPTGRGKDAFTHELSKYKGGKGTVQFPFDRPIPYDLIARIAKFRVAENGKAMGKSRKPKSTDMKKGLIAPCGMNCGICSAFLRLKNTCPGCRGDDAGKSKSCARCRMKNCLFFRKNKTTYCFECNEYPCDLVRHIDKRYRTRYGMSMIENLENIKTLGIRKFLKNEAARWACPVCNGMISVHNKKCYTCDAVVRTA